MRVSRTLLPLAALWFLPGLAAAPVPAAAAGAERDARPEPAVSGQAPQPAAGCLRRIAFVLEREGLTEIQAVLAKHEERLRESGYLEPGRPGDRELLRLLLPLGPGRCTDLVWPDTAEAGDAPGAGHVLLASSAWYEVAPLETLSELLSTIGPLTPEPRLADAVAVAAARGTERPAAVVLVTAAGAEDGSRLAEAEVAELLHGLGVRWIVWRTADADGERGEGGAAGADGGTGTSGEAGEAGTSGDGGGAGDDRESAAEPEVVEIAGWSDLERAVDRLRELTEGAP